MTSLALPALPALVPGSVAHRRHGPIDHDMRHSVYQWLVDLDQLPQLRGPLAKVAHFSAADHLGDPARSIKDNVLHFAQTQSASLPASPRVIMLANARVLGYVFDPISVFWVLDRDTSDLSFVVAEVHNTYGERHAYLLYPDESGNSDTDKAFYVSPFYDLAGRYRLHFSLKPERVAVTVNLHRGGDIQSKPDFSANFNGTPEAVTPRGVLAQLARHPLMSQKVSALIKAHGIYLWAKGLPIQPRPQHQPPEGS